jgi:hypothetical protein
MPKSWLPPDPGPGEPTIRDWWRPKPLTDAGAKPPWEKLAYVVVDELHEGVAGLVASPWPVVDDLGRVRFGSEQESVRILLPAADLLEQLARHRTPVPESGVDADTEDELRTRDLAIGDVFAMRFGRGRRWSQIRGPILDITAEAREVAKAQAAATAAGVVDEDLLDEIAGELGGDDGPPPTERRARREGDTDAGGRKPKPIGDARREEIRLSRAATGALLRNQAEG